MSNSYEEITGDPSRKESGRREQYVNVGHGNFVARKRIIGIMGSSSLPMKRKREEALDRGLLIDATKGKKTKSLIVTDSNHVFLSSLTPQTLHDRLESGRKAPSLTQIEMEDGEFAS